jgi:hypothetical protein
MAYRKKYAAPCTPSALCGHWGEFSDARPTPVRAETIETIDEPDNWAQRLIQAGFNNAKWLSFGMPFRKWSTVSKKDLLVFLEANKI